MWVRAMETYDRVAKVVGPKKEALALAMEEYAAVMAELTIKRAELQKVRDELASYKYEIYIINAHDNSNK